MILQANTAWAIQSLISSNFGSFLTKLPTLIKW